MYIAPINLAVGQTDGTHRLFFFLMLACVHGAGELAKYCTSNKNLNFLFKGTLLMLPATSNIKFISINLILQTESTSYQASWHEQSKQQESRPVVRPHILRLHTTCYCCRFFCENFLQWRALFQLI